MDTVSDHLKRLTVAAFRGQPVYPDTPPWDPEERYPEYDPALDGSPEPNVAYRGVREVLRLLGLDRARYGSPQWNPLGEVIRPGQTVVVKPNFVLSDHYRGGNLFSIITHPAVIRAVVDYAAIALRGEGKLIIADTPQVDCDFGELLARTRLESVRELYQARLGLDIEIRDLRDSWFKYRKENYVASQAARRPLPGDPEGSVWVDLGSRSAFAAVQSGNYYGADYDRRETIRHHTAGRHEYRISGTMLRADVILSVPKLKVHKKVGVTLNAKGFVGTVTNKNSLIHFTVGAPERGGDQVPPGFLRGRTGFIVRAQRVLSDAFLARGDRFGRTAYQAFYWPYRTMVKPFLRRTTGEILLYDGGNWHGNDSAWRMVSDLNKILLYADATGRMTDVPQRRVFSVVDGIVGGEGNGPLFPDAKPCGVVLAGCNHLAVDIVAARLMGFDPGKLRWVGDLLADRDFSMGIDDTTLIRVESESPELADPLHATGPLLGFRPHPGWVGHLEFEPR